MTDKIEKILSDLSLIQDGLEEGDAFASVSLNPTLRWMKFILTDDRPNENKQQVPETEFDNLINTGVHMPIKMAVSEIKQGHDEAVPLGVITNLRKVQNRIEGLAALWSRERPDDVEYVINEFKAGRTPQISWEIPYTEIEENQGIQVLKGICLRAATLVGLPAYAGRTPVLAVASKTTEDNEMEDVNSMEEIETLKAQLKEAQDKVAELEANLAEKTASFEAIETELTQLREFKSAIDKDQADAEKLAAIKAKFAEAGITKDDEYFVANKDMLMSLDEAALNFMVQELVAFASVNKPEDKKEDKLEIPGFNPEKTNLNDVKTLAQALRDRQSKK